MDIDQTNGDLFFVFYDRREYDDNRTDVFLVRSEDGGTSFLNKNISASPFVPNDGIFFGDYTNIFVHDGIVRQYGQGYTRKTEYLTDITPVDSIFTSTRSVSPQAVDVEQYPSDQ